MGVIHKKRRIGIIGVGHVGMHVASMLITHQVCEELILIEQNAQILKGQMLDLQDSVVFQNSRCEVVAGNYEDLRTADILVISVGATIFDENRLEELEESKAIIDEIAPQIEASRFCGIVISITNPCDLIAYYLNQRISATVIGSGTILDSARYQSRIATVLQLHTNSIEATCIGEHGDSQVLLWSRVRIGGKLLSEIEKENPETLKKLNQKKIEQSTIFAGWEIAAAKGSTEFGIGAAVAELARCILKDEKKVVPCSVMLQGEYGINDVYASVPCTIGENGVEKIWQISLSKKEEEAFQNSCKLLKKYIVEKELSCRGKEN